MKFEKLKKRIEEYEDEIFSSRRFKVTTAEIEHLAEKCIDWFVTNRLDGILLDFWLAEKREL